MGRSNFDDVNRLVDPLAQYNFDLLIPQVPGVLNYDARNFKTRVMTTSIPGRTIEPIQVDLHGVSKKFAGRVQYTMSLPFELIELRDMESRRILSEWHRFCRNNSSLGAYEREYATTADLLLNDDHDKVVEVTRLTRVWLESYDDAGVDGSASAAVTVSGTLSYMSWDRFVP